MVEGEEARRALAVDIIECWKSEAQTRADFGGDLAAYAAFREGRAAAPPHYLARKALEGTLRDPGADASAIERAFALSALPAPRR